MTDRESTARSLRESALLRAEQERPGLDPVARQHLELQLHWKLAALARDAVPDRGQRRRGWWVTGGFLFGAIALGSLARWSFLDERSRQMPRSSASSQRSELAEATHPVVVPVPIAPQPAVEKQEAKSSQVGVLRHARHGKSQAAFEAPTASPPPSQPPSPWDVDLSAERALLSQASAALKVRADPSEALSTLALHRQRFPAGQLADERDALEIRALVALGRNDEARAHARAFESRAPHSLLLPVIQSSLESTR
jgi:hypothetical protein